MCLHSAVASNDAGEKSHAEAEVAAITVVQRPREGGREGLNERVGSLPRGRIQ